MGPAELEAVSYLVAGGERGFSPKTERVSEGNSHQDLLAEDWLDPRGSELASVEKTKINKSFV